jgi:filamentous hemagglutinin
MNIPMPVLVDHEAAGGHLIAKHVGKTDVELVARLVAEPGITGASTFYDLAAAARAVEETIKANEAAIGIWLSGSGYKRNYQHRVSMPVGRVLTPGASSPADSSSVRIVVVRNAAMPGGFLVLTGYPQ